MRRAAPGAAAPGAATLCFGGLFLLGLAARLHGIAGKPLWMDEVTTLKRASLPPASMLHDSLFFHQMPAFFIITSWAIRFGTDEFWLRLPAALFGALSCALGFGIARTIGGWKAGLAAGLLIALSPAMVQYGQEARSYTAVISFILVGLWGLVRLAQGQDNASSWAAYILGTLAALNILSVALFWFLAANLAGAYLLAVCGAAFRRRWLLAQLLIIALCLPWYIAIKTIGQRGGMGGLDWVPPLSASRIWWAVSGTYLLYVTSLIKLRIFAPAIPGLGLLTAALAAFGLAILRRRPAVAVVLATALFSLPIALLAISLVSPVLMPRYLLWSAAPFAICAGLGLAALPRLWQTPALVALALLLALNLAPYYRQETKPRWDLAAAELSTQMRPGALLLVDDPQAVGLMNLYLARTRQMISPASWTTDLARAAAWRATGKPLWAAQGPVGQVDHESQAGFLRRIALLGAPDLREHAGLDIVLLRFGKPGG